MGISLKLDVAAENLQSAFSLCEIVRSKIENLFEHSKRIVAIEIHLFESLNESLKGATLFIRTSALELSETSLSKNWEDAFEIVNEKIYEGLFKLNNPASVD